MPILPPSLPTDSPSVGRALTPSYLANFRSSFPAQPGITGPGGSEQQSDAGIPPQSPGPPRVYLP